MRDYIFLAFIIIISILIVVESILTKKRSKAKLEELTDALAIKDYARFYTLIDEKETSKYVAAFNIIYLKYTAAIMRNDAKRAYEEIKTLEKYPKSRKQAISIYSDAFYYFASNNQIEAMKYCYGRLNKIRRFSSPEIELFYNVYCEKSSEHLQEILIAIEKSPETANKVPLVLLTAQMYKNINDEENALKYAKMASELLNKKN
jgi:hypothetical protein